VKTVKARTSFEVECAEALKVFWKEQLATAPARDGGVVLALPLMYPNGLQVVVEVKRVSEARALVSDRAQTLTEFFNTGFNFDGKAKQTHALLTDRLKAFELNQDGFELKKEIKVPIEGVDLHVFGETVVSIAHLIYRHEPEAQTDSVADRTVRNVFRERGIIAEPRVLTGSIEKKIRVDYYYEGKRPLAMEVIKRRGTNLGYIEQWAWRWTDLRNYNAKLLRAMIYDPQLQELDPTILEIGQSVCELFVPYHETRAIHDFIASAEKD
jgi:hypothetical protein